MSPESGERLVVQSVGMVCPVGLDAASASAAVRARLPRFQALPFHDQRNQPITGASVPEVVRAHQGFRRLVPMLVRAIGECVARREKALGPPPQPVPLLIALGEAGRPDLPKDVGDLIMRELQAQLAFPLARSSRVLCLGPPGLFHALTLAEELLMGKEGGCIIATADSLVSLKALMFLEQQGRLKTETNSDGVIPAEAAAAVWVTRPGRRVPSLLRILGVGTAQEPSAKQQDGANLAEGLALALRRALGEARLGIREVDFRVGGVTGERTAFMEASTAFARLLREPRPEFPLWLPAEILGDVGAALPGCMLGLTTLSMVQGYAPGHSAILFASAEGPERGACVVARSPRGS